MDEPRIEASRVDARGAPHVPASPPTQTGGFLAPPLFPSPPLASLPRTSHPQASRPDTPSPPQIGVPFPPDFLDAVRNIFRRLFRIYAHIYYCHFDKMSELGAEPHLNTCGKGGRGGRGQHAWGPCTHAQVHPTSHFTWLGCSTHARAHRHPARARTAGAHALVSIPLPPRAHTQLYIPLAPARACALAHRHTLPSAD
jgi:hypothetical protein